MAIAGLRGTGDWGTDERPKNFRETILWLNPNGDTPLTALMGKTKTQSVNDPEFSWWEETLDIVRLQVNGSVLIGGTTFTVDNGQNGCTAQDLKVGDLLLVEAGSETAGFVDEIIQVTAVNSATEFEATRGVADTTATPVTDDWFMTVIGSAYAEGTGPAEPNSRNPTKFYNYTQIFKDGYEITNTADATRARTGDTLKNDKKRKMFDHSTRLEMAMLFGKRHETTGGNGKPLRFTGGLLYYLAAASRTTVKGGAYTDVNGLFDDLYDVFDYSVAEGGASDQRIILCGNGFMNTITKLLAASGEFQFESARATSYGMHFKELMIPQGTLYFKTHPLMNRHARYTNSAFVLNGSGLVYRPLQGRDTKPKNDVQEPGQDSTQGEWLTEAGPEFHHMQTMKFLTNVSI